MLALIELQARLCCLYVCATGLALQVCYTKYSTPCWLSSMSLHTSNMLATKEIINVDITGTVCFMDDSFSGQYHNRGLHEDNETPYRKFAEQGFLICPWTAQS